MTRPGSHWVFAASIGLSSSSLDHQGNLVAETLLNERHDISNNVYDLLVADCDGDGNDDIVVTKGGLEVLLISDSIQRMYHLPISLDEWGASTKVAFLPDRSDPTTCEPFSNHPAKPVRPYASRIQADHDAGIVRWEPPQKLRGRFTVPPPD